MQKLVIDRQRWLRGETANKSYLLRLEDCKMCCLGFYCLMLGFTEEEIQNLTTPSASTHLCSETSLDPLIDYIEGDEEIEDHYTDSQLCEYFTALNDSPLQQQDFGYRYLENEQEREEQIATLFRKELGVEVEFIN